MSHSYIKPNYTQQPAQGIFTCSAKCLQLIQWDGWEGFSSLISTGVGTLITHYFVSGINYHLIRSKVSGAALLHHICTVIEDTCMIKRILSLPYALRIKNSACVWKGRASISDKSVRHSSPNHQAHNDFGSSSILTCVWETPVSNFGRGQDILTRNLRVRWWMPRWF